MNTIISCKQLLHFSLGSFLSYIFVLSTGLFKSSRVIHHKLYLQHILIYNKLELVLRKIFSIGPVTICYDNALRMVETEMDDSVPNSLKTCRMTVDDQNDQPFDEESFAYEHQRVRLSNNNYFPLKIYQRILLWIY